MPGYLPYLQIQPMTTTRKTPNFSATACPQIWRSNLSLAAFMASCLPVELRLMEEIRWQNSWVSCFPIVYRVLYIPSGAGFFSINSSILLSLGTQEKKHIHSLKHCGLEDEFWEDFLVSAMLVFWEGNMAYNL